MKSLLLLTALLAPLGAFAAPNLLVDGSFENGISPTIGSTWTVGGTIGAFPVSSFTYSSSLAFGEAVPADPLLIGSPDVFQPNTKGVYFVDDAASQTLSQTFMVTTPGLYQVGFDFYLPRNGFLNANNAVLTVTGFSLVATLPLASFGPAGTWQNTTSPNISLPAGSYTYTFTFLGSGFPSKDVIVDRAFVTAVPEPGTYGMMLAGLLALGFFVRRRGTQH